MKKRILFILLVILGLLVGACGASSARSEADYAMAPQMEIAVEEMPMSDGMEYRESAAGSTAYDNAPTSTERLVIRNASLSLVVPDPAQHVDAIAALAEELGGYVVSSNLYQNTFSDNVVADRGSINIRVPSQHLDEALERIKEGASEIRSQSVSGEDVTDQYTDLNSRLRNLEAAEEELLEIMEEARDSDDVLAIFEHLRQIREEIELTRGRIQYYEQSARLSSISVDLIPDAAAQPLTIGKWQPEGTAKAAVQALISALKFLGNSVIWIIIFVAPVLFLIALPVILIVRAVRKRRAKKKAAAE